MAEMKPKVAKRITTSQPHPTTLPPPTPTPFHHLSANKLSRPKLVRIGSKEASACTKLGGIRTDNHFQRITEYWY